ncbi:MAG: DUF2085 domain-containing protein [Chloroflexi bacterium]|nr:DUF2085 domain-containing protein [Chloroflexota bacterium]
MEYEASSTTTSRPHHTAGYSLVLIALVVSAAVLVIGPWLLLTPDGFLGKLDAVGYATCHRIAERSFSAYDRQLPLCARCSGIYLGMWTGLGVIAATGRLRASRLPDWKMALVLVMFVAILGVDGLNSYFHLFPDFDDGLYQPNNTLRVTTGAFVGLAMIHLLLPTFNAAVWRVQDRRRALEGWQDLGIYCAAVAGTVLLTLSGSWLLLYVFGIISALGILFVLTLVNSVMFIAFLRRDRTYHQWGQLWLPALAGLTAAILLIGGMDAMRFALTGTWEGFVFGTE